MHLSSTRILIGFLVALVPSSALAVEVYRYYPSSSSVTIDVGDQITFSIGADDPYGLDFSEWYLGSTFQAHHEMSGYYDEDTWSHTFSSSGTYNVYAYVYNIHGDYAFTWWEITVVSHPPSISRVSPSSSSITIAIGSYQSFTASASDPDCDLDFFEWYLDNDFQAHHGASGCSDQDSWGHTFNSSGTFHVYAYIYDEEDQEDMIWWQVTVESHPPSISRVSPSSSSITLTQGSQQTFRAAASDADCERDYFEWYLESSFQVHHSASGCSDEDDWSYTFNQTGTFHVYAYIYDEEDQNDMTWWQITVEPPVTHPPEMVRLSPEAESITLIEGEVQAFSVRATDEDCDLDFFEWYLESSFQEHHEASGCSDDDSWSHRFDDAGVVHVYAYIYDEASQEDMIWWEVTVQDAPMIYRYSPPDQSVTVPLGTAVTFHIGAADPYGLDFAEWYVGSTFHEHHDLSGYYDEDNWAWAFDEPGTHHVYAYVYNIHDDQNFIWWEVSVGDPPDIEHAFFDDFQYADHADPQLSQYGWSVVNGINGPPEGARYTAENVSFAFEPGEPINRLAELSTQTTNEFEDMRLARLETADHIFFEGTYAARVRFDNAPRVSEDGNVQTFYAIHNAPGSEEHAECDFEYLPWNVWGGGDTQNAMYMVTWETDTDRATDIYPADLGGWHTLLFQAVDGVFVRYYIDGVLRAEHDRSDGDNPVYPDSPMQLALAHWIFNRGAGSATRSSTIKVDWVFHAKNFGLSTAAVTSLVEDMRSEGVIRHSTMNSSAAEAPSITRLSPSGGTVTVPAGGSLDFRVAVGDENCDLAKVLWILGEDLQAQHDVSGCSAEDTWSVTFPESGTFAVHAHVADAAANAAMTWWEVTVTAPQVFVVRPDGSGDFPTIQAAIDASTDGGTIELADGTFRGDGNRDLDFHGTNLTIRSQSGQPASCTIDCEGSVADPHRGFHLHSGETAAAVIDGLSIVGGYRPDGDYGSGIRCTNSASPTIRNCILSGHTGGGAGGMYAIDGTPRIEHCTFIDNSVVHHAGALQIGGASTAYLEYVTFASNSGGNMGGALLVAGTSSAELHHCTFCDNGAPEGGAIAGALGGTIMVDRSIVVFSNQGAAVFCSGDAGATLTCCDVYGNAGGDWAGCIAGQGDLPGNLSADPLFCDREGRDFTLDEASPCAPEANPACGLIGAWPVGCAGAAIGGPPLAVDRIVLGAPFPNPFIDDARITYAIPESSAATHVDLSVHDASGRRIARLVDSVLPGGTYAASWNGVTLSGRAAEGGVYFFRLRHHGAECTQRVILLR